jgi:Lipocalin-like domain
MLETGQAVVMNDTSGFIMYGRDGRMMALMLTGDRPTPVSIEKITDQERVELFRSMIAYGGTYTFDGKTVEHQIDISSNGVWTGTTQIRDVKREQGRIILTTRPAPSPFDGKMGSATLVWEKVQ